MKHAGRSITAPDGEDGRFTGPLAKPGHWRVDVEAEEPSLKASMKVEVRPKKGRAAVEIDLPDTKVHGRVVDPAGAPAPGAFVALSSTISTLQSQADERGEFDFRAFPEGNLEISAEGAGRREVSDTYSFEAAEGSSHGPVVLALRRNQAFRGKVLAAPGPVIGATVSAWPSERGAAASTVRTRIDGSFEVKVPEGTQAVTVVVSPPTGALKAFEVNVLPEAELLLQVEPQGGDLVVDIGKEDTFEGKVLVVWQGHIGIPLSTLIRWTEGNGVRFLKDGQVHIPRLAPGFYTVCLGNAEVIDPAEIEEWKTGRAACASGYLIDASTLDLRLR